MDLTGETAVRFRHFFVDSDFDVEESHHSIESQFPKNQLRGAFDVAEVSFTFLENKINRKLGGRNLNLFFLKNERQEPQFLAANYNTFPLIVEDTVSYNNLS